MIRQSIDINSKMPQMLELSDRKNLVSFSFSRFSENISFSVRCEAQLK